MTDKNRIIGNRPVRPGILAGPARLPHLYRG